MLALLSLAIQVQSVLASGGHGGTEAFEWAGIFETNENQYTWTAQKTKNANIVKYADATMKMVVLPATDATEAVLHALEEEGSHSLGAVCTEVGQGGIITPKEDACYLLRFKQDWWQTLFTIDASGHAHLAFFTEHVPTEFENTDHYLKDDHGDDIEPVAELPEVTTIAASVSTKEEDDYWGPAIGVAILVNIITLVGVVFAVPAISAAAKTYAIQFDCLTSAFAAGAIAACAFFLLLFESTHLVATGWDEEVDVLWRWGTMILAGTLLPVVAQLIGEMVMKKQPDGEAAPDTEKNGIEVVSQISKVRLVSGILVGDFVHNLVDGFFIGAAFKGCGTSAGWTVATGTIAHELAQELADYAILTGKDCKLHPAVALGLNFLCGTSVLLGVVCILSADIAGSDTGLLLAFGGGVYLYIAFVECFPKLCSVQLSPLMRASGILMFIIGAVAIGLVLLDHQHCVPPAPPGAPAATGHNH